MTFPSLHGGIRGKRNKRPKAGERDGTVRKTGRPSRAARHLSVISDLQDVRTNESSRLAPHSPLLRLPEELLHQIFFWSLEINLPLSSPMLANKLSSEPIYRSLILLAFYDADLENDLKSEAESDSVEKVDEAIFRPAEYRYLSSEEREALQIDISECRWYTRDRLDNCLRQGPMNLPSSRVDVRHFPSKLLRCRTWADFAGTTALTFLDYLRIRSKRSRIRSSRIWPVSSSSTLPFPSLSLSSLLVGFEAAIYETRVDVLIQLLDLYSSCRFTDIQPAVTPFDTTSRNDRDPHGARTGSDIWSPYAPDSVSPRASGIPLALFHLAVTTGSRSQPPATSGLETGIDPELSTEASATTTSTILQLLFRASHLSLPADDPTLTRWALSTRATTTNDNATEKTIVSSYYSPTTPRRFAAFLLAYMEQQSSLPPDDRPCFVEGMSGGQIFHMRNLGLWAEVELHWCAMTFWEEIQQMEKRENRDCIYDFRRGLTYDELRRDRAGSSG